MGQYFNFSRLIQKYSTELSMIATTEGEYDSKGEWQPNGETETVIVGAVISHRESKIFRSDGAITQQDRALYMTAPLPDGLQGAKIVHEGRVYRIGDELQNAAFTGVWAYTLKYVSAFDVNEQGGDNGD